MVKDPPWGIDVTDAAGIRQYVAAKPVGRQEESATFSGVGQSYESLGMLPQQWLRH